ncbi:MAG: hypothetical protein DRJ31_10315, partial [Candidatus Methanomethylicota archaeon]
LEIVKAVDLSADITLKAVGVDELAKFNLTVVNTGLYPHDYEITCTNKTKAIVLLNGVATNATTLNDLGPGESAVLVLGIIPRENKTFTVAVRASTVTAGGVEDEDEITIIVVARAYYGVRVTPSIPYMVAERNESVAFMLEITNVGNVNDTYELEVVKPPEVESELSADEVFVQKHSAQNVVLTVRSAYIGVYDIGVVVKSKSDPAVTSEASLSLEVVKAVAAEVDADMRSAMITQLGGRAELSFNLTVINTGLYPHNYTIKCYGDEDVIITLNGVITNTTTVNVNPRQSTIVPIVLNVTEGEHSVMVSVYATTAGNVIDYANRTITAAVSFEPIYGVEASVDVLTKHVKQNEVATFNITIVNTGNVPDTFDLVLVNPAADQAELSEERVSVGVGQSKVVTLNVSDPEPGEYRVEVIVTSEGDPTKSAEVETVTFVEGYGLILTADTYSQTRYTEESATYTLTLRNIGNVMDNYTLAIDSNCAYEVSGYNVVYNATLGAYEVFGILAGDERLITLRLVSTEVGTYYANVTAISQGDPTKLDYVNVTAEFRAVPVYGLELTVTPRLKVAEIYDTVLYTVRIKNTGNVPDTYVISATEGTLENTTLTLGPGEVGTTTLSVYCDAIGTKTITVTARSVSDQTKEESSTVYATVTRVLSLEMSPGSQSKYLGEKARFTLTVTNIGVRPHTFILNVTSNTEARLSATSIYLEPEDSMNILLTMNASQAGVYSAEVKAYASDSPLKNASVTASVVYLVAPVYGVRLNIYPSWGIVEVGKEAVYMVTVENIGNMNDTYRIWIALNETPAVLESGGTEAMNFTKFVEAGKSTSLILKVTPTDVGSYNVIIVAESPYTSDSGSVVTIGLGIIESKILKSIIKYSSLIKSHVEGSELENSFVDPSQIYDSDITSCVIRNSTVYGTALSNVELYNTFVKNGEIYNGTIKINDVAYDISEKIGVHEIVVATDQMVGSIVGVKDQVR